MYSYPSLESVRSRGKWANKTEFMLACMGYAIGIGNVWRFPYLCYRNGGGAFLVPYLLMLPLCGVPLFFMETCIGQFSGTGCITMFRISPFFKGVGWCMVLVNIMCTVYYNVILAYPLLFIINCMRTTLPWVTCGNEWNTPACIVLSSENATNVGNITRISSADEYFHNHILQISSGIEEQGTIVLPLLGVNILSWLIVFFCIMNGVRSVGKVVYFTVSFPYVVLIILFARGVTLPGAWEGIKFYIYPDWDTLTNLKVWADAAIQMFFSLGPGWGGIVNMASYNRFNNRTQLDSIFLPLINVATSIFAGFVVFSVLGFMSHKTGLPVATVATGGPSLAFVTYPEALALLPFPVFWAIMFFLMLYMLGVDSCFVQIEAIISSLIDEYPSLKQHKKKVAIGSIFVMFLGSLSCITNGGMYTLQLLDWYTCATPVITNCLIEVLIIGWIYKVDNFIRDVEFMTGSRVNRFWKYSWKYITPLMMLFISVSVIVFNVPVTYNNVVYPMYAVAIGWLTAAACVICIPIYMVYHLRYNETGTLIQRIKAATKASDQWGPPSEAHRMFWKSLYADFEDIEPFVARRPTKPSTSREPEAAGKQADIKISKIKK